MKLRPRHFAALGFITFAVLASPVLAQSPSPAGGERGKTLWEQIREGGWVMVPIGLCSIATLYLIGDGILRTSPKRMAPPEHEEKVKELFRHGDYVGAYKYTKENPSPLDNVLRVGIGLLGEGKEIAEEGMLGELARKIPVCKPTLATSLSSVFAPP